MNSEFEFKGKTYVREVHESGPVRRIGVWRKPVEPPVLTAVMQKTFDLIKQGRFYPDKFDQNPAVIKQLEQAGLIRPVGRVVTVQLCFVPTEGYTPFTPEQYEE